jgi:hypothetical protein
MEIAWSRPLSFGWTKGWRQGRKARVEGLKARVEGLKARVEGKGGRKAREEGKGGEGKGGRQGRKARVEEGKGWRQGLKKARVEGLKARVEGKGGRKARVWSAKGKGGVPNPSHSRASVPPAKAKVPGCHLTGGGAAAWPSLITQVRTPMIVSHNPQALFEEACPAGWMV